MLSGAADALDLAGGYGAVSRRVKQFMPNLRTAVYNNLVPWGYGWSAHVKDLKNTARDFGEAFVTGSQISPRTIDVWDPNNQSTKIDGVLNAGRYQMMRDRLGIVADGPEPYKIDATTKDGTHIMHYADAKSFGELKGSFNGMNHAKTSNRSVKDLLGNTGGNVGFREDLMGNWHMFDRWDTQPFLTAPNFTYILPGANTHRSIVDLGYKIHPHLPKKIKNWDPLDLISVRPAPIQYNVFPKDATSLKDFEEASSAYNKANAEKIRTMWEKRGGFINYIKNNYIKTMPYQTNSNEPYPIHLRRATNSPIYRITEEPTFTYSATDGVGWEPKRYTYTFDPQNPSHYKRQFGDYNIRNFNSE